MLLIVNQLPQSTALITTTQPLQPSSSLISSIWPRTAFHSFAFITPAIALCLCPSVPRFARRSASSLCSLKMCLGGLCFSSTTNAATSEYAQFSHCAFSHRVTPIDLLFGHIDVFTHLYCGTVCAGQPKDQVGPVSSALSFLCSV